MKTYRCILRYFSDLLQSQRDLLSANAAVLGELQALRTDLQALKADRSEQLERVATSTEYLARVEAAHLSRSGHSI
jgi:hypothetical protein